MIVVDASAMVEALVGTDVDPHLLDLLSADLAAPHLLDVEVLSVLGGLERGRKLSSTRAEQARDDYFSFTISRHETPPLAERIWALRHQFTSYDATYLALAEALETPLVTLDAKLAATGHHATVLVPTSGTERT
ncbi:MAG: type II toxin-antitoxin system VapC family toxin [Pedococcus sp.]